MKTPTIHVVKNGSPTILIDLIKAIHQYYPVGFELPKEEYPGYQELIAIVEQKISQMMEGRLPENVNLLEIKLKEAFPDSILHNQIYKQFPNYTFSIEIANELDGGLDRLLWMTVNISLLTKHYTVFFQETMKFGDKEGSSFSYDTFGYLLISFSRNRFPYKEEYFLKIEKIMMELFPGYEFVSHSFLFANKVKYGVPFGETDDDINKTRHSIFSFLFDNLQNPLNNALIQR